MYISWLSPKKNPTLQDDEIHLWKASLDRPEEELFELWSYLSDSERSRANKFISGYAKNEFIVSRGILRFLLSNYLSIDPRNVVFQKDYYGKPSLDGRSKVQFNISHSHGLVVFIFVLNKRIGIDVENINRKCDLDGLAKRYFLNSEVDILMQLSGESKLLAFFNFWTCKEAVAKANGMGIYFSLNKLQILNNWASINKTVLYGNKEDEVEKWFATTFKIDPNYVVTFAVESKFDRLKYFDFCF